MGNNKSFAERIFHALTFEVLAILISAPALSWLAGVSIAHAGLLTLMISLLAMLWNMLFNTLFDRIAGRFGLVRTFGVRILHAVLFELGLVALVVALMAWWLEMRLLDAFLLDIGLILFFLPYTFLFNLAYDKVREAVLKKPARSLLKQFILLAIPTLLSGWVYTLYTFVDGIFIGRYLGAQALAALNLLVPLMYVPYAVSLMIGVGAATLIARLSGQQRLDEARRVFTQALWCMFAIGLVLSLAVLANTPEIAQLMGASGALALLVEDYLSAYAWFILFAQALYALEFFLRAEGSKAAVFGLYAMFLGALVNILLDYVFIVVVPLGMKGAGLATGISMLVSSATMLSYHVFKAEKIKPCRHAFKGGSQVGTMLYNGSSEFLGAIAPVVTVFVFNRMVLNAYGETGLAAYAILEYMTLAAMVTMVGLVQSMQPLISFYRGANQPQAMRSVLSFGAAAVMGVAVLIAVVMLAFSRQLTFLFLPDGGSAWAVLEQVVLWYALAILPAGCNLIAAGYLTAVECPGASAIIAVLRSWVLLLASLWLLNAYFGGPAIWYALLITELLTLMVSAWLTLRHQRQVRSCTGGRLSKA